MACSRRADCDDLRKQYEEWRLFGSKPLSFVVPIIRGIVYPGEYYDHDAEREIGMYIEAIYSQYCLENVRLRSGGCREAASMQAVLSEFLPDVFRLGIVVPDWLKDEARGFDDTLGESKKVETPKSRPARAEQYASTRETILGAAVALLVKERDLCVGENGAIGGTSIAEAINEKALLFWPDIESGKPPLGKDKISREINSYIRKLK